MNKALNALYALQQVDTALALANRQFRALDQGQTEQAAAESARALHARTVHEHHETAGDLKDSELELKTLEENRKKFETKLYSGKVTAFKELESIQQEIEALGRQRGRLDERILTLMDQLEARRAAEAETEKKLAEAEAALAAKQAAYKAAARKLAVQIQSLTAQRVQLAAPVAANLMTRYEAIRKSKQGVGISKIEGGLCGGCHTQLPTALITSVERTEAVETCENCGRLLCVDESA
jgi:predicted  nucleic acid-binding Zn-ribbon protein